MNFLKNHPFAVDAFFKSSIVLTFAVPKEELEDLIPDHLELDTYDNKWAFVAIAMVQTKNLRPKNFPEFMGNDFFLIGFRIFVKYRNKAGKRLRGLYIIKSETNKKKMQFFGNIFTHYNYTTTDISQTENAKNKIISSKKSDFKLVIDKSVDDIQLPTKSPFKDWKDARKFAGPLPHTFTFNKKENSVLIILGVRKNWKPKPLAVSEYHFSFLNSLQLKGAVLANAFEIENVPYHWKKGKLEKWN
ncbi:DUF2071 domain-containing protein [Mesonia sp.]|uniref:DUF2071 domain-containing protein n=1 Tax=Mesonia sp. TaxID=1960830 RepID=UPI00175AB94A|nr:DUF2071 domain-containing protein [Mesonia sp.]HIB37239.1 hypothetical protein [Mesonia sp.]HIO26756.1 hypothetical protein [Flavobacteriaceae bacterium]